MSSAARSCSSNALCLKGYAQPFKRNETCCVGLTFLLKPSSLRNRHRGFHEDTNDITFITDRRSHKVEEVAANPAAEVCWYFPNSREQYRMAGMLKIVQESDPDEVMRQVSNAWLNLLSVEISLWWRWQIGSVGEFQELNGGARLVMD